MSVYVCIRMSVYMCIILFNEIAITYLVFAIISWILCFTCIMNRTEQNIILFNLSIYSSSLCNIYTMRETILHTKTVKNESDSSKPITLSFREK